MSLVWKPRKKIFEDGARKVSFDPETFEAKSYGWWIFVRRIGGKIVFNNHRYSATTAKHQSQVRGLLQELKIKVDLFVDFRSGLDRFESEASQSIYREIVRLQIAIARKGSKPKANEVRRKQIVRLERDLKLAKQLKSKLVKERAKDIEVSERLSETNRLTGLRLERERNVKVFAGTGSEVSPVVYSKLQVIK